MKYIFTDTVHTYTHMCDSFWAVDNREANQNHLLLRLCRLVTADTHAV